MFLDNYFLPHFEPHEVELRIRFKALVYVLLLMVVIVLLAALMRYRDGHMQQAVLDSGLAVIFLISLMVLKKYKKAYWCISRGVIILSLLVMIPGLYVGDILLLSLAAYVMTLFMMLLFTSSGKERLLWYGIYFAVYLVYVDVFIAQGIAWSMAIAIGVGVVAITFIAHTNNVLNVSSKEYQMKMYHDKRTELLGNMLSMIAHQWRQPLAAINSAIGTLQVSLAMSEKCDPEEIVSELENITERTSELSHILSIFTSMYLAEGINQVVTGKEIVQDALKSYVYSKDHYDVTQHLQVISDANVEVRVENIKVALWMIFDNAYDQFIVNHIDNATINMTLAVEKKKLLISVWSNTPLIPEKLLDQVFDPYFSTKQRKNGVGLGLYIAQSLVTKNRARIFCTNSDGGVLFTIQIPIRDNKSS